LTDGQTVEVEGTLFVDGSLNADRITIDGSHTFNTGEGFIECYTTQDTADLNSEMIGEVDGRGHNPVLTFFHPGAKKDAFAFADAAKNDTFILLVETLPGEFFQIGFKNLGANITANFASGTLSSGRLGWSFTATAYGPIAFYGGTIEKKPDPPAPVITNISPISGSTAGGDTFTVTGSNFTSVSSVRFDTTEAASFTIDSDTQITVTSPSLAADSYPLVITNPEGQTTSVQEITIS